jgi:O-antigen/teichoic acid export membrane protein
MAINLKHNIIANFAGKAWSAIMALAFLPLYVRFLGIEAYGLIGVFASLTALFSVFDMGLSTTLSKELARLSAQPGSEKEARDLVRTLEIIYWGVGALIGVAVAVAAPWIAHYWVNAQGIAPNILEHAIAIMGLVIALQWPISLYSGGLMGLQRQILLNVVRIVAGTLQAGGAVMILWLWSPTILAYFIWQILAGALFTAVLAWCLWMSLPSTGPAVFQKSLLAKNWRFAGGMMGITLLVTILTQTDKIILSKMLALETFGYYSLATVISGALTYISNPIFSVLFPRFSQALSSGNSAEVAQLYHKGCQLMSLLVLPTGIFAALFSKELLLLWFGDGPTAMQTYLLASLLTIGATLNALVALPYALQLASGWTGLVLKINLVSVAFFVPSLIWLVDHYGAVGAALAWIALNASYLFCVVPLMHRRLLRGSMGRWYLIDVGLPMGLSLGLCVVARSALPSGLPSYAILLWIVATYVSTMLCVALAMPFTRKWLRKAVFQGRIASADL